MSKKLLQVEHFVFVCQGKDCKKHGAKDVVKSLQFELKKNGYRDNSLIIKTKCMGACKKGPVVVIQDESFTKVKPQECEFLVSTIKTKEASFEAS